MKKLTTFALLLILAAGMMTACRNPMEDTQTTPTTQNTTPSTQNTMPSTQPTQATTTPATQESTPDGSAGASDPTADGARRRNLPRY